MGFVEGYDKMASPPNSNAFLVCDHIITEVGTNKRTIVGVFEVIFAAQFPLTYAIGLYYKFTDAQGDYIFRFDLVDLTSNQVIGSIPTNKMTIPDPLQAYELVISQVGATFPHAGRYEFQVYANGQICGQKTLTVVPVQPQPVPPQAPQP